MRLASRNRNRHQTIVGGDIKEVSPIEAPARCRSASNRELRLRPGTRERLHVDLTSSGLVRNVGYPAAVRRKSPIHLVKRRRGDGERLAVANERQRPQVGIGLWAIAAVQGGASIGRPVPGILVLARLEQ